MIQNPTGSVERKSPSRSLKGTSPFCDARIEANEVIEKTYELTIKNVAICTNSNTITHKLFYKLEKIIRVGFNKVIYE